MDKSVANTDLQFEYLTDYDSLTGIYNKAKFFHETNKMIKANIQRKFVMIRFDIDRFQLINSFYGMEEGDRLLCYLAKSLQFNEEEDLFCYGRMEGDIFALCFAYSDEEYVLTCIENAKERVKAYNRNFDIVPIYGIYFIDDLTLPVNKILDRATLVAQSCKGNFIDTIGIYKVDMSLRLERHQEIYTDMKHELNTSIF